MTPTAFGTYPTPVENLDRLSSSKTALWVKRDDRLNERYGGNKVRKLEWLLADARERGKKRILTLGAAGSHQVVATALFGKDAGFDVEAVLVSQPHSEHAERNLGVALAAGLDAVACPAWGLAPFYVAARMRRDAYFIPLGGSSPLGSIGFVDAARELAAQVERGEVPEPDVVVVALGSGGTAAGLAVGLELAGMKTRVVAVAISPPAPALGAASGILARVVGRRSGLSFAAAGRAAKRIEVDGRWIGRGYGYPTDESAVAIIEARSSELVLDPTYTAKAFACALELRRAERERTILYWHTFSTVPLPSASISLPKSLSRLLPR